MGCAGGKEVQSALRAGGKGAGWSRELAEGANTNYYKRVVGELMSQPCAVQ